MIRIPSDGQMRDALIDEHRRCTDMMKGVAGFSVLRTERPGSAIAPRGGIHENLELAKVLVRMRAQPIGSYGGKYIVVCTKHDEQWRVARLAPFRGVPPQFVDDIVYDDEQEAQHAIFLLRLQQFPESDGMPSDFHEGWKRGDDNWA